MAKIKIALVEDDEILSKVVYEELKEAGFDVSKASDGKTGVKLVKAKKPDLVLLDIIMPKLDGFGVLKEIKSDPNTASIPVIVLTMLGSDEDIKKGLQLGANDYIVKSQHAVAEVVEKVQEFFGMESHPEGKKSKATKETPKEEEAEEK